MGRPIVMSLAHCDIIKKLSHAKAGINQSQTPGACLIHPGVQDILFCIMSSHHDLWSMFYQFHCCAPCNIMFLSDWATMRPYSNMEDDNHGDKSFCVPPYTADVLGKLSINSLTLGGTHLNNIVLNLIHDQFQQHYYWKLTEICTCRFIWWQGNFDSDNLMAEVPLGKKPEPKLLKI